AKARSQYAIFGMDGEKLRLGVYPRLDAVGGKPHAVYDDEDASEQLAADERVHAEVVRGLAIQGREKISGNFRAAVFGANDGLVSNLALVIGVMGSGAPSSTLLLTGVSGLLAGALSM